MEFLNKAEENLTAAKVCFDNRLFNACANRAHYAALHAAIAALAHRGIRRDKIDHGQVQADFSNELINRRKIYPSEMKSYLPDMQMIRNMADYSGDNITQQRAGRWFAGIKELIGLIKKELDR